MSNKRSEDETVDLKLAAEALRSKEKDSASKDVNPGTNIEDTIDEEVVEEVIQEEVAATANSIADYSNNAVEYGEFDEIDLNEGEEKGVNNSKPNPTPEIKPDESSAGDGFNLDIITGDEIDDGSGVEGGVIPPVAKSNFQKSTEEDTQNEPGFLLYGFFIIKESNLISVEKKFPTLEIAKAAIKNDIYYEYGDTIHTYPIKSGTPGICIGEQEIYQYSESEWVRI